MADVSIELAAVVLAFLGGMTVPTAYGRERLRGFGRWMASKLPYEPPPGHDDQDALEAAGRNGG